MLGTSLNDPNKIVYQFESSALNLVNSGDISETIGGFTSGIFNSYSTLKYDDRQNLYFSTSHEYFGSNIDIESNKNTKYIIFLVSIIMINTGALFLLKLFHYKLYDETTERIYKTYIRG